MAGRRLRTDRYRVPLCGGCHHPAGQHPGYECRLCGCKDYLDGEWGWWSDEQTERLLAAHNDGDAEAPTDAGASHPPTEADGGTDTPYDRAGAPTEAEARATET